MELSYMSKSCTHHYWQEAKILVREDNYRVLRRRVLEALEIQQRRPMMNPLMLA